MHANAYVWYLLVGGLLLLVVMLQATIKRLPVSTAILYLLIGIALGPSALGWLQIDVLRDAATLETVAELALLISLFSVGLKMRVPLRSREWLVALRLAIGALVFTIVPIALLAHFALGLPLAVALLLAAVLSPTDPVLASDVQLRHADDRDRVRFSLTAEGGVNDGIAFPFVILALGWLGLSAQHGIAHWIGFELLWPISIGLLCGWASAYVAGKLALVIRRRDSAAIGLDEFLALGVMGVAYGLALLAHGNGFLAVFAAGLALRRFELQESQNERGAAPLSEVESTARPEAPARLMRALLTFNEQLEHILEVGVVLVIGALLRPADVSLAALIVAAALFVFVRPLSVYATFVASALPRSQLRLIAWFGIRGVGSLYYLMYALNHGLAASHAREVSSIVLPVLAASIIVHGISATPLMERYSRTRRSLRSQ